MQFPLTHSSSARIISLASLDNATTATTGIDYSGRDVPPLVPPEVNNNYPYLVSMIPPEAVPFQEMSTPIFGR